VERLSRNPPVLLLATALLLAAAMTLVLTSGMTFFQDTWAFLIERREISADTLFRPHNEHIVVFPALIEMVLIRVFGMTSALPEYVLLTVFLLVTAALLFVYLQRRVGQWLALFAAVIVLTLGPAWEALLWPFEITFVGPIMFGLAMLLALERGDRRGDIAACAVLTLAMGFSGVGICFLAAAAVAVLLGPRETWLNRAYVFAIPLLLYVIWWLGWGHDAETHISIHNLAESPAFVINSVAYALQSMLGLGPGVGGAPDASWGKAILVGLVLACAYWWWRRRPRIDPGLWPVLAAAIANWFLTALNAIPGRDPSSSRYQYAGVIFVVLIAANLLKGVRPSRTAIVVAGVVTIVAVGPNMVSLKDGRDVLKSQSVLTRADTAAIEIARRTVPPEFELTPEVAGTPSLINIYAGKYLEAVDEYGSPAYSQAELAKAPEGARKQADIILGQALPLSTVTRLGGFEPGSAAENCIEVPGGGTAVPDVTIGPGTTRIEVAPGDRAEFSLGRFAVAEYPVSTEGAPGDSVTVLNVPRDSSRRPWHLHVQAEQEARVCR
jgi:hypothetical protein